MLHMGWTSRPVGFSSAQAKPPPLLEHEALMNERKASACFWLPETPDAIFWGSIEFVPGEGTEATIEGELVPMGNVRSQEIATVHGRLFDGSPFSLFDCRVRVETFIREREYHRTTADSELMVMGHYQSQESCTFDGIRLRLSHLDDWFTNSYDVTADSDWNNFTVSFRPDKLDLSFEFQGVAVRLRSVCNRGVPAVRASRGPSFPYTHELEVHASGRQKVRWFLELAALLRQLFVFLIGSGVYTLEVAGVINESAPDADRTLARPGGAQINLPVIVPRVIRSDAWYFATRYEKIKESLQTIVASWFRRQDELSVIRNSYSELMCSDGASPETVFLRTVQTLEHLHGLVWPKDSLYVRKGVFRRFLDWIRGAVLEHASQWNSETIDRWDVVLNRLGGLNQLSFRSRLERIFTEIPGTELMPILNNPVNAEEALDAFLRRVEATRNYLTHFDLKERRRAFNEHELESAALMCWAALSFWMAKLLDMTDRDAGDLAVRSKQAMFLVQPRTRL